MQKKNQLIERVARLSPVPHYDSFKFKLIL